MLSNPGYCTWCESETVFTATGTWLRDQYVCSRCGTIPRQRALIAVLGLVRPDWRDLRIHESSPGAGRMLDQCPRYSCSYYFDGVEPGTLHQGYRCENLEAMTFDDESFDLFITQDVFEHVFEPARAFAEIERILADGGLHVFTTPVHKSLPLSRQRAKLSDGRIEHLLPPEYHGNPISSEGSLVTWDYGQDIDDLLARWCGFQTSRFVLRDRSLGLDGEYLDVFVTTKNELNRSR